VIDETLTHVPLSHLLMHFHDTEGMGLANVYASLQMGVYQFEASLGGLGGCPFSPGASGNIDTMDTVNMLNGLGIETGIDLKKLKATAKQLQEKYPQLKMPSHVLQVAAK
jgi:hydroxymethylglutaryl-CoA lyase